LSAVFGLERILRRMRQERRPDVHGSAIVVGASLAGLMSALNPSLTGRAAPERRRSFAPRGAAQ
jgi:hypothetical protein